MTQCLAENIALDLSSTPSTRAGQLTLPVASAPGDPMPRAVPAPALTLTYPRRDTDTYTQFKMMK